MRPVPRVSIVMPVFNDEGTVAAALKSCLAQTETRVEVICVDDGSTDGTVTIIQDYAARDARIRLIRHQSNRTAFQARRTGIHAASSEFVLFLDGDDELLPIAAERSLIEARRHDADLVGFAVEVVSSTGDALAAYQKRLAPKSARLTGDAVISGLFPLDHPAQGQLWRFLFRTQLLHDAYDLLPDDLALPRINDLPLLYITAMLAIKYVSIPEKLYRYHFGRGGSGQPAETMEQVRFYAEAIRSVESIAAAVRSVAQTRGYPDELLSNYESVRLSIIGYVASYLLKHTPANLQTAALDHLYERASATDLIVAAVQFYPEVLPALKSHSTSSKLHRPTVRNILLTTRSLSTGGVSGVLLSQAKFLTLAGYNVTIVARRFGSDLSAVPEGVSFIEMTGRGLPERLIEWSDICRTHAVDVVVDHQILYSRDWPEYALAARVYGAATVGWVHNFAGRPLYDRNRLHNLLRENAPLLETIVTLSPLDAAFWKLRGARQAVYIPNPPSPLLTESVRTSKPKNLSDGPLQLIWWGRLEEHTKQVSHLIEVAAHLRRLSVDFQFTVIGPDWGEWTQTRFNARARARGVDANIRAVGELRGQHLIDAIDDADMFVSTSIIEGYPLTLPEAQSRGLPVFMYDLPWLALLDGNAGVVRTPQGDAAELATQIAAVAGAPDQYARLSRASIDAARLALAHDFGKLYDQVVTNTLPQEFAPEPTLEESRQLLDLMIYFAEQNADVHSSEQSEMKRRASVTARTSTQRNALLQLAWRASSPLGRTILQVFPSLRPLAQRVKGRLALIAQR